MFLFTRQTTSNDWYNKLYHYDWTFSQLFSIVLIYFLKWYFSRNVIHLAIKFLSVYVMWFTKIFSLFKVMKLNKLFLKTFLVLYLNLKNIILDQINNVKKNNSQRCFYFELKKLSCKNDFLTLNKTFFWAWDGTYWTFFL